MLVQYARNWNRAFTKANKTKIFIADRASTRLTTSELPVKADGEIVKYVLWMLIYRCFASLFSSEQVPGIAIDMPTQLGQVYMYMYIVLQFC